MTARPTLSDARRRFYVAGLNGGRWHIAAHEPLGAGVASICGHSWREGWYSYFAEASWDDGHDIVLCTKCRKKAE